MKKPTTYVLLLVFVLLIVPACQFPFVAQTRGSGKIISEHRLVRGFERVSLSGVGDLTILEGEEDSLVIDADDNLVDLIESEVRDGTLYIGVREDQLTHIQPSQPIQYRVTIKELTGVELTGTGNITVESVTTEVFDLQARGSGDVRIRSIQADLLAALIDGSGNCEVEGGMVERQKLEINGSGNYAAPDLQSKIADVQLIGSGNATLWVIESLDVVISGSGGVSYYGSPEVQFESEGTGELKELGEK